MHPIRGRSFGDLFANAFSLQAKYGTAAAAAAATVDDVFKNSRRVAVHGNLLMAKLFCRAMKGGWERREPFWLRREASIFIPANGDVKRSRFG